MLTGYYNLSHLGLNNYLPKMKRTPMPEKYNNNTAKVNKVCVIGSVDGVNTAAKIVENTTTYFHIPNICLREIIPTKLKII